MKVKEKMRLYFILAIIFALAGLGLIVYKLIGKNFEISDLLLFLYPLFLFAACLEKKEPKQES